MAPSFAGTCPRCGRPLSAPNGARPSCPTCRAGSGRVVRRTAVVAAAATVVGAGWWWATGDDPQPKAPVDGPQQDTPSPVPPGELTRVACVGDSITAGNGLADPPRDAYPAQLADRLGVLYEVAAFAAGGRSVSASADYPYTDSPEYPKALAYHPHRVVLLLGTNDGWPQNWRHRDRFAADYGRLVQAFADSAARPRVYLCTPPPLFGDYPGGLTEAHVGATADLIRAAATRLSLPLVDLHARLADARSLFPDRLHPDREGAGRIAREVYRVMSDDGA